MLLEQLDEALPDGARRPENADANLPHRCSLTHPTAAASIEHTYKRSARGDLPRIAATLNNVLKSDRPRPSIARAFLFPERCDTADASERDGAGGGLDGQSGRGDRLRGGGRPAVAPRDRRGGARGGHEEGRHR